MQINPDLLKQNIFSTSYTYSSLSYFFSSSEWIDYEVGKSQNLSLQIILSNLQQVRFDIKYAFGLFSYLFTKQLKPSSSVSKNNQTQVSQQSLPSTPLNSSSTSLNLYHLSLNNKNVNQILQNDGLKLIYSVIWNAINNFQKIVSDQVTIDDQMMLKLMINVFYVIVCWIEKESYRESRMGKNSQSKQKPSQMEQKKQEVEDNIKRGSPYLNQFYKNVEIDNFLIKLLTLSLQAHYIPIKKVTMLYNKVLANIFSYQSTNGQSIFIHPVTIFNDSAIQKLPTENTLDENYLEKLKEKNPPLNQCSRSYQKIQPIEQFYRKHNMGDCPLAQSIVVGLLRSLLTICNSQNHKKFNTVRGAGVDSFRQWQLSYRFAIENWSLTQKSCSTEIIQRIKDYQQFDRQTTQKSQPVRASLIFHQFYMHKIYTTSVITNFFMIILLGLKLNVFIQYLYFLQLISDANGILVLLKFLTDKFQFLDEINDHQFQFVDSGTNNLQKNSIEFKDKVMLTVYSILNMLHSSCNNYPQKVKNYLFQYNSYLIIKKIPVLFFPAFKNSKSKQNSMTQSKKKDEMQGSLPNLPSKQQLQELMLKKPSNQDEQNKLTQQVPLIIRHLTQTCYDLLKIQIPYFSKKMKDTNNMKMLIDIYCRFPKTVSPIKRSPLEKMQLKCRSKKHLSNFQQSKPITSVQEMKNIHNQYNNLYYWSNDFVNQMQGAKNLQKSQNKQKLQQMKQPKQYINQLESIQGISPNFDYEQWLEQNIWKYYD